MASTCGGDRGHTRGRLVIYQADFFVAVSSLSSGECVVNIRGPIEGPNAPQLREALLDAQIGAPTRLTVDLAAVSAIDAGGLDVLVAAYRRATVAGITMVLQRPDAGLAHVLAQNGLPTVMPADQPKPNRRAFSRPR